MGVIASRRMAPRISIIAALAENRVIGRDNRLPWHLPADLGRFKALTMGKPMLMGRRTWESLPGPLPGRPHLVLTRDPDYRADGCRIVHSLKEALEAADDAPELMVIGGAELYAQALPLADRLYLTLIQASPDGDAFFPEYDPGDWREIGREDHPPGGRNPYRYSFLTLERCALARQTQRGPCQPAPVPQRLVERPGA